MGDWKKIKAEIKVKDNNTFLEYEGEIYIKYTDYAGYKSENKSKTNRAQASNCLSAAEILQGNVPAVSPDEMTDIKNLYGKPKRRKAVRRISLDV